MNRRALLASLSASLAACPVALMLPAEARTATARPSGSEAARAAQMISAIRQAAGLPPVSVDSKLSAAAQYQAKSMAEAGAMAHGDFAGRVRSFGIGGQVAENLAYGSADVAGAIAQWQGSAAHQANLLLPGARRIGLGRADGGSTRFWALVIG